MEHKTLIFERIAETAAALGSPARLLVIQLLSQAPRSVEDLAQMTGFSVANVSQHLKRLSAAQIVQSKKLGTRRIYSLTQSEVGLVFDQLVKLTDILDPQQRQRENLLTRQDELGTADTPEVIRQKVHAKQAVLIDVRSQIEHESTPVPGSVPIALELLKEEASQFSKTRTIYVLCRGPYCTLGTQAVKWLRSKGFDAYRIRDSMRSFLENPKRI